MPPANLHNCETVLLMYINAFQWTLKTVPLLVLCLQNAYSKTARITIPLLTSC